MGGMLGDMIGVWLSIKAQTSVLNISIPFLDWINLARI